LIFSKIPIKKLPKQTGPTMQYRVRIATFNLENFDDKPGLSPSLTERISLMKPELIRLNADILCLQEVNGQESPDQPRQLLALQQFISGTQYETYHLVSTKTADGGQVYDERNLVILSRYEIESFDQFRNDLIHPPMYRKVTALPGEEEAKEVEWERPLLSVKIKLPENKVIHVINVHLKSKIPTNVAGQKINNYTWKTASGWAEGYFISSMKRVGQALEARVLVDEIFDGDENAFVVVCGDFNADSDEVPVKTIAGQVEETGNCSLSTRVLYPCESGVPDSRKYSLFHHGKGEMIDHLLVSRNMLQYYRGTEIHNEILHDESLSFADDKKYPESDHAPIVAEFLVE
jgi:endonuclease/exonuclease/phosphatase family metal-dependent hydrolase